MPAFKETTLNEDPRLKNKGLYIHTTVDDGKIKPLTEILNEENTYYLLHQVWENGKPVPVEEFITRLSYPGMENDERTIHYSAELWGGAYYQLWTTLIQSTD